MKYRIIPMSHEDALEIAEWHYDPPYSFYDLSSDDEDRREFLDTERWRKDQFFSVLGDEDTLCGFLEFENRNGETVVGLGLRPDLTGKGLGADFVEQGLCFASRLFGTTCFSLIVATFNTRAISLYHRIGFMDAGTFMHSTNGGEYPFLGMRMDNFRCGDAP